MYAGLSIRSTINNGNIRKSVEKTKLQILLNKSTISFICKMQGKLPYKNYTYSLSKDSFPETF
jgi:hypothetical protein